MSDMYIDELEMRLRFAEEDTQERERLAFQIGRESTIDEVMDIVKTKISEKEYPIETMVELTDLGVKILELKDSK